MTTQSDETPDIRQRLLQAMESVGYIQKDGKNTFGQGYKYLSEKAVKEAVQAAFIEAKVMPRSIKFEVLEDMVRPVGKREQNIIKLRCIIKFDDGYEFEGLGAAADVSDKALMQAQTSAIREAYKNVFSVPSGDDPEQKTPGMKQDGTQEAPEAPKGRVSARKGKPASDEELKRPPTDSGLRTQAQYEEILGLLEAIQMDKAVAGRLVKERYDCIPPALTAANATDFITHLRSLKP